MYRLNILYISTKFKRIIIKNINILVNKQNLFEKYSKHNLHRISRLSRIEDLFEKNKHSMLI